MTITKEHLARILEAALMASGSPLSIDQMLTLFLDEHQPTRDEIREALDTIAGACENRGVELKQVSSGYRFQAKQDYAEWIGRLWEEKPPRYSRALLETLVLVAYRQPITRSEIEDVRGVTVSSHIIKTLQEREWVRVVGHRDVPGKPALYATTKQFLDYFNLKSLDELPTLQEIRDLDKINAELELEQPDGQQPAAEQQDQSLSDSVAAAEVESAEDFTDTEAGSETDAEIESSFDAQESDSEGDFESADAEEGHDLQAEADEEENEEMLYARGHDENADDSIDDKYADASGMRVIEEPDEPVEPVSDDLENIRTIET